MTGIADAPWLIYGANGFTGRLIAEEAVRRGLKPVLGGRSRDSIAALAAELALDSRVFSLDSPEQVAAELQDLALVINCAGPFNPSADIMVQACIKSGVHYLDISGEPEMFEKHLARHAEAAATGAVVIPGVGFDVVPSDTLAKSLADRLPGATSLEMAFFGDGAGSAGSAKTVMGMMADKGKVRRNGQIKRVPLAWKRRQVKFSDRQEWCMSIPWGDISTAYHSTGIPDITMYMAAPRKAAIIMRLLSPLAPLLGLPAVRKRLFAKLEASVQGPDQATRERCSMRLWGRACDGAGQCVEATVDTPEGFTFTTAAALLIADRVLSGPIAGGCYTPTQAFGTELAFEIPGTALTWRG